MTRQSPRNNDVPACSRAALARYVCERSKTDTDLPPCMPSIRYWVNFLRLKGGGPKRQRLAEATEEHGKSESKRARISNVEQDTRGEEEEMHEQSADMGDDGAEETEAEAEVKYRGVQLRNSGRYTAAYKRKTIGTYDDAKHAALAYDLAVLKETHTSSKKPQRNPILNFKTSLQVFQKESEAGRDPLEDIARSYSSLEIPVEPSAVTPQKPARFLWMPMQEVQRIISAEDIRTQRGYVKWLQEQRQRDPSVRALHMCFPPMCDALFLVCLHA